jgi:hypothetical protein
MRKVDFLIMHIGLLLPYRMRIYYALLLNYLLAPLRLLKRLLNAINRGIIFVLALFTYYIGFSITLLLKPKKKDHPSKVDIDAVSDSLYKMY